MTHRLSIEVAKFFVNKETVVVLNNRSEEEIAAFYRNDPSQEEIAAYIEEARNENAILAAALRL
jgi:hypothetical protein